jgi:hypothetical protein
LVLIRRGETASARPSLRQARLILVRLKEGGTDATPILELYETALIKLDAAAMSIEEKDTGTARDALQQAREVLARIKKLFPGDDALLARLDVAIANLQKAVAAERGVVTPVPAAD